LNIYMHWTIVDLVVIRLGVSGAIYHETYSAAADRLRGSVDRAVALATLKAVHIHSVKYLSKFVQFRSRECEVNKVRKGRQTSGVI